MTHAINPPPFVIPAQAGIQEFLLTACNTMDSRLRGNDVVFISFSGISS